MSWPVWLFNTGLAIFFSMAVVAALIGLAVAIWHREWSYARQAIFAAIVAAFLSYVAFGCRGGTCNLDGETEHRRR